MHSPEKLPIMSCKDAKNWERRFFDESRNKEPAILPQEGEFIRRAGTGIAKAILAQGKKSFGNIIALVGKGHNGADALVAARLLALKNRDKLSLIFFVETWDDLAPLTMDAYEAILRDYGKPEIFFLTGTSLSKFREFIAGKQGLLIDGIYGHSFRPPLKEHVFKALVEINEHFRASLRVAVDLPSGLSDVAYTHYAFVADITCATGIVKKPLLREQNSRYVGKVVPVAIGFPVENEKECALAASQALILPKERPIFCDKRSFGHLAIIGGSREMPGALMLNTLAALRAGAGLVTVICPESVHAAFAARAPAAMWLPCKETERGSLDARDAFEKLSRILPKVNTILCGSGMGTEPQTTRLIQKIASEIPKEVALVFDADALQKEMLETLREHGENLVLPHMGEYLRMGGEMGKELEFCERHHLVMALKGPYTCICNPQEKQIAFTGTPALARGGSGDLLAGITAAVFASRNSPFDRTFFNGDSLALLRAAVLWHGNAAQHLARQEGIRTANILHLLDYLNEE